MADFFNPAALPVPPAAQAIEERRYTDPRSEAKRKAAARPPRRVEEPRAEEPDDGQPKHALDLNA